MASDDIEKLPSDVDDPARPIPHEQLLEMLHKLESGRYRKGTVWQAYGYCRQACYMRELRNPEFRRAIKQAMARGEMRQIDLMHDSDQPAKYWWTLERIHGLLHPKDRLVTRKMRADIKRIEAETRRVNAELEILEKANMPGANEELRSIVAQIVTRRPAPPPEATPQPEAGTDAAVS